MSSAPPDGLLLAPENGDQGKIPDGVIPGPEDEDLVYTGVWMANVGDDDDRDAFPEDETWEGNDEVTRIDPFPDENIWDNLLPLPVDTGATEHLVPSPLVFRRRPIDLDEPIWLLNLSVRRLKVKLDLVPPHVDSFAFFPNVRRNSLRRQLDNEARMLQRLQRAKILLALRYNFDFFPSAPLACVPFDCQPF